MLNLGLKLWSTNTENYLPLAQELYDRGIFQYIELYVVPDTLKTIEQWKKLKIPFTLHAPHFMNGINLAKPENEAENLRVFKQVEQFQDELSAKYVVIHGGIEGEIKETVRQMKKLNLKNPLIENKPYKAPLCEQKLCRGAKIEEIKFVIDEVGCGFCLDVGHAMCTANSLGLEPYEFLKKFNELNPACCHLSDNFINGEMDKHFNLGKGNYDFKKIFAIIDTSKNIAIETNKNSKENLDDFVEDVKWLKSLKGQ